MASLVSESTTLSTAASSAATPESRLIQSTSIVSREIAGETIVVPICRGVGDMDFVYTFNALGTQLWGLLAKGHTESELVEWVTSQYAVDTAQATEDVRSFLADLRAVGLVAPM